jgi:hypothetical protein
MLRPRTIRPIRPVSITAMPHHNLPRHHAVKVPFWDFFNRLEDCHFRLTFAIVNDTSTAVRVLTFHTTLNVSGRTDISSMERTVHCQFSVVDESGRPQAACRETSSVAATSPQLLIRSARSCSAPAADTKMLRSARGEPNPTPNRRPVGPIHNRRCYRPFPRLVDAPGIRSLKTVHERLATPAVALAARVNPCWLAELLYGYFGAFLLGDSFTPLIERRITSLNCRCNTPRWHSAERKRRYSPAVCCQNATAS